MLKVEFNYFDLNALTWAVWGKENDSGSINIDNIRFIPAKTTTLKNNYTFNKFPIADNISNKIFNRTNDSLFRELKEYQNKSKNYYLTLRKIHRYEKIIDSVHSVLDSSFLSKREKQNITALLSLAINQIPGDVSKKTYLKRIKWKKKYSKYISYDTLCLIDLEYQRSFFTLFI